MGKETRFSLEVKERAVRLDCVKDKIQSKNTSVLDSARRNRETRKAPHQQALTHEILELFQLLIDVRPFRSPVQEPRRGDAIPGRKLPQECLLIHHYGHAGLLPYHYMYRYRLIT